MEMRWKGRVIILLRPRRVSMGIPIVRISLAVFFVFCFSNSGGVWRQVVRVIHSAKVTTHAHITNKNAQHSLLTKYEIPDWEDMSSNDQAAILEIYNIKKWFIDDKDVEFRLSLSHAAEDHCLKHLTSPLESDEAIDAFLMNLEDALHFVLEGVQSLPTALPPPRSQSRPPSPSLAFHPRAYACSAAQNSARTHASNFCLRIGSTP